MFHRKVPRTSRLAVFAVFACWLMASGGCGYRRPQRIPTTGTLLLDNSPVPNANLVFLPAEGGRPAMAQSDENGQFTISSFGGNDGLPAGRYKLLATKLTLRKRAQKRLDAFNASQAADNGGDIQFTDADYRNMIPARYSDPLSSDYEVVIEKNGTPLTINLSSDE